MTGTVMHHFLEPTLANLFWLSCHQFKDTLTAGDQSPSLESSFVQRWAFKGSSCMLSWGFTPPRCTIAVHQNKTKQHIERAIPEFH
jgi:hypothetical protein